MKKFKVQSASEGGKFHTVEDHETFMTCSCKGYNYRKKCAHVKAVLAHIHGLNEETKDAPF